MIDSANLSIVVYSFSFSISLSSTHFNFVLGAQSWSNQDTRVLLVKTKMEHDRMVVVNVKGRNQA